MDTGYFSHRGRREIIDNQFDEPLIDTNEHGIEGKGRKIWEKQLCEFEIVVLEIFASAKEPAGKCYADAGENESARGRDYI